MNKQTLEFYDKKGKVVKELTTFFNPRSGATHQMDGILYHCDNSGEFITLPKRLYPIETLKNFRKRTK